MAQRTNMKASRHDDLMSTNVSSPIQQRPKHRSKVAQVRGDPFVQDEDDVDDYHPHPLGHNEGYERDGFCVSDELEEDAFSDDGFPPVREEGKRGTGTGHALPLDSRFEEGEKTYGLTRRHRDIVDTFVHEAKGECQKILINRNLRQVPFTDTMLREMAIRFTSTKQQMLKIPGIDPDKVNAYGDRFLKLVQSARQHYEEIRNATEDRPFDPNHRNVVDLISDEEDEIFATSEKEDTEYSPVQQSRFFNRDDRDALKDKIEAYNAKLFQSESQSVPRPPPQAFRELEEARKVSKKRFTRKGAANTSKADVSGRKRQYTKKKSTCKRNKGGASTSTAAFGDGQYTLRGGGISAMPTF